MIFVAERVRVDGFVKDSSTMENRTGSRYRQRSVRLRQQEMLQREQPENVGSEFRLHRRRRKEKQAYKNTFVSKVFRQTQLPHKEKGSEKAEEKATDL